MISSETFRALVRGGCQIAILAFLLYYVLKFLRRTRAYRILAGIVAVLLALYGSARVFGFDELGWLFEKIASTIPMCLTMLHSKWYTLVRYARSTTWAIFWTRPPSYGTGADTKTYGFLYTATAASSMS